MKDQFIWINIEQVNNRRRWRLYYRMFIRYEYNKNDYKIIALDLSWQRELDADPKAIQWIEFVGQIKKLNVNGNVTDTGNEQSMFVLTILEKIREKQ